MLSAVELYKDIGPAYQDAFSNIPAQLRSVEWILTHLSERSRILDVGCGTGRPICSMLSEAGHTVFGLDLSPEMLEAARQQVPDARFEVADAKTWTPPSKDLPFDAVTSYFAFLVDTTQQDTRDFFRRAYQWLRPGGLLAFATVPADVEHQDSLWLGRRWVLFSVRRR